MLVSDSPPERIPRKVEDALKGLSAAGEIQESVRALSKCSLVKPLNRTGGCLQSVSSSERAEVLFQKRKGCGKQIKINNQPE